MVKTKELSNDLRHSIIDRHTENMGYRKIAGHLKIYFNTVGAIVCKWKIPGVTLNLHRTGRPRKVSSTAARHIARTVIKRPFTSPGELRRDLKEAGNDVSKDTGSRTLHRVGLHSRSSRKTPLLKSRHVAA
jgi:transposase